MKPAASEDSKVENINQSILKQMQAAPFACGGSIQISEEATPEGITVKPVQIRFSARGAGDLLTLPADADKPDLLNKLLAGCQPATFGRGQQDILEESYRKASKLDTTAFVTDFCPYAAGIIDVVAQLLLPKVADDVRGVRAELYKLNVYSAPSGKFKAHVDTPRSEQQFGSLVVCLPVEHEGQYYGRVPVSTVLTNDALQVVHSSFVMAARKWSSTGPVMVPKTRLRQHRPPKRASVMIRRSPSSKKLPPSQLRWSSGPPSTATASTRSSK